MSLIIVENYTKNSERKKILVYAKLNFFFIYYMAKDIFKLFNSLWNVKKTSSTCINFVNLKVE